MFVVTDTNSKRLNWIQNEVLEAIRSTLTLTQENQSYHLTH